SPARPPRTAPPPARLHDAPPVDRPAAALPAPGRPTPSRRWRAAARRWRSGWRRGMADAPGPEYLLPLPLTVHLAHHGRQLAGQAERQPAPGIMIERDGAGAHPGRVDARLGGPLPDARVVLTAADHIEVEGRAGRLQLLHALRARCAVGLDEDRQAPEAGVAGTLRLGAGQAHARLAGKQALPRRVLGPLVGQRLADAPILGLHLLLGVAPAPLLAAGLDAQPRERIELGRIDPERPLHRLPVTCPLLGAKPPLPRLSLVERGIGARLHLGGHHARVRHRGRLGGCAEGGEQDDGSEQRPQDHGQPPPSRLKEAEAPSGGSERSERGGHDTSYGTAMRCVWPFTWNTPACASMDCSCQPPSASPSRSSRAPASEAAAVEVIDRKRSPP